MDIIFTPIYKHFILYIESYLLDGGLVKDSCHWNAIKPLHGSDRRLHGFLRSQVRYSDVMREQVAIVLQPRLRRDDERSSHEEAQS